MLPRSIFSTTETSPHGARRDRVSVYPQLERLCQDFGLQILSAPDGDHEPDSRFFGLAEQHLNGTRYLTPVFPTLSQLERFVVDNTVDILHSYFFGEPAEAYC
jgi:hypothetical protein